MLSHLFSTNYLFDPVLASFSRSDKFYSYLALLFVIIAVAIGIYRRYAKDPLKKSILQKWSSMFWTMGLLAVIWVGMRNQLIPYFSTHIVIICLYVIAFIWALFIIKFYFTKYKKDRARFEQEKLKQKYL